MTRDELLAAARRVRLVAMDVDGTLTDGAMYYAESGNEWKKFNTRDGMGLALLRRLGLKTAILTQENTRMVERRGAKMRVDIVRQGVTDKLAEMHGIVADLGIGLDEVAYIGDDLNDVKLLRNVGLAIAVADATPYARSAAHHVTSARGGDGAVRELCELIVEAHGLDPTA
jgi:YrbI family 3-deoxy-D-manno-octulosonate 8-phosphate phosphatase